MKTDLASKSNLFLLNLGLAVLLNHVLGAAVLAQSSAGSISFQGALTGAGGQPLPNDSYTLGFQFWDHPTSTAASNRVGGAVTVPGVAVSGGVASTAIPVQPDWFNGQTRYLGTTVQGVNAGQELLPRVLVTAVPYAMGFSGEQLKVGAATDFVLPGYQLQVAGSRANILLQDFEDSTPGAFWTVESEAYSSGNFGILRWLSKTTAIPSLIIGEDGRRVGIGTTPQGFNGLSQLQIVGENADIMLQNTRGSGFWTIESDAYRQSGDFGIIHWEAVGQSPQPHFIVSTLGNVGLGTHTPQTRLEVNGTTRTTVLQITSARAAKEGFAPVDAAAVLAKVASLPIATWAYTNSHGVRHLGPVAEDFHAAFGLGDSAQHIATVDADGVALAAIQGLHQLVTAQQTALRARESEVHTLQERLERLERLVTALAGPRKEEGK